MWDNIIVTAIENDLHKMLLKMIKCLTVLHTLKQFVTTPLDSMGLTTATNYGIKTWYSAQILLPDWIYEVFERREAELKQNKAIKYYTTNVGRGNPRVYYNIIQRSDEQLRIVAFEHGREIFGNNLVIVEKLGRVKL